MKVCKLYGSLEMNDIKQEDAMLYDDSVSGLVDGIAVIVDGATGFQKNINEKGEIFSLSDITSAEHSSARIWADILAEKLLKNAQKVDMGLVDVLKKSIEEATKDMPITRDDFESFQTPSASVLVVRLRMGSFDVIGSGDNCLVVKYKDNEVDAITGNTILDNIRAEREIKIRQDNPDFDSLSKPEQAKIKFRYMKRTRETLGDPKEGYFVPFYNSHKAMDKFLGEMVADDVSSNRSINKYGRGDIWVMHASLENISSFMMSSDGFIDKAFRKNLITKEELIAKAKKPGYLQQLGLMVRGIELNSDHDSNATAMKVAQGKADTGSADDAVALYFGVKKDTKQSKEDRLNLGLALATHYKDVR